MQSSILHPYEPSHRSAPQKALAWAKAHQEIVAISTILFFLLLVGIPYYLNSREQSEKDAMGVLNLGQYYIHSQVDPVHGPFKSEGEKQQQALQTFLRITTDYAGTSTAKLARFYAAKCQMTLAQYPLAYSSFEEASQELKGTPLGVESYLGKILCLEAQNQSAQAMTLAESFLKENPDSFLGSEIRLNLADLYLKAQKKDEALELLQTVQKTETDSHWGKEAARRLESLKS